MLYTAATQGICPACRFGADCIYEAGAHHRPILECEQFELAMPPAPVERMTDHVPAGFAKHEEDGRLGLCANCDFRDVCIYPKNEGGVWRCEEYR